FQKILEFVALSTKNFCSQLRGDFHARNGRILSNVADFVHLDAGFSGKRSFQLFCKRCGFCISGGNAANKVGKMRLRQIGSEMNAGNTGSGKELCETALCGGCTERDAIQQDLCARSAEQKSAVAAFVEGVA